MNSNKLTIYNFIQVQLYSDGFTSGCNTSSSALTISKSCDHSDFKSCEH